jgi:hypothetical protein
MTSSGGFGNFLRSVRGNATTLDDPPPIDASSVASQPLDPVTDEGFGDGQDPSYGIHGVLKKTDYWFNLELNLLEKSAREDADAHARAGLPRADVPLLEELPAETVLRERARRVYLDWSERVKRKVQDAVHAASDAAIDKLAELRHTFEQVETTKQKIGVVERLVAQRKEEAGRNRSFEYGKLLRRKKYFALMGLLVLVDWVANVPVFQQVLPQEPGAEQAWLDIADRASRLGSFAGLVRTFERIAFQPDVSLLAFGVVTFLMVLAHFSGSALRRIVSFRPKDETASVLGLRSHRRQAWTPFLGGLCGIVLVVGFLFFARSKLAPVATERRVAAAHQLETLQENIHDAQNANHVDQVQALELKKADAQNTLDVRSESADYAQSISSMNTAIFLLNLTLVIVATLAAYLESSASMSEARWADPGIGGLETQVDYLQGQILVSKQAIRRLSTDVQLDIARARYLAQSLPLRDWEGKARRLEAVIPIFRSENARLRGIDVHNIVAFKEPCRSLELPILGSEHFEVPPQVDVCERDFNDLRGQMYAVSVTE